MVLTVKKKHSQKGGEGGGKRIKVDEGAANKNSARTQTTATTTKQNKK